MYWTMHSVDSKRAAQRRGVKNEPCERLVFIVAERIRRSNQLLKDLSADIEHQGVTWQTNGIQSLYETVNPLQVQLRRLVEKHRRRFERVDDRAR